MTEPFEDGIEACGTLCDRCTTIKLDTLFGRSWKTFGMEKSNEVIIELEEPKESTWLSSCSFCQLLKAVVDPRYHEDEDDWRSVHSPYYIMSFNPGGFELGVYLHGMIGVGSFIGRNVYSLYSDRYLCFVDLSETIRVVDPGTIDFAISRSWIESCRGKHQQECCLTRPSTDKVLSLHSKREVTCSVDALNALLGVFRFFRQQKNAVHHFWGIPVITPTCKHRKDDAKTHETFGQRFVVSLSWVSKSPGARRPGFPKNWIPSKLAVSVSIGRKDGSFVGFQEAFDEYIKIDNLESLSRSIRIKGWTIDLFAKLLPPRADEYGGLFNFYAWPASTDQVDAQLATKVTLTKAMNSEEKSLCQIRTRRLLGVIIEALRGPDDSIFTLVVEEIGEGKFGRVGHLNTVGSEYDDTMKEISISSNDCVEIDLGEKLRGGQNTYSKHEFGLKEIWLPNRIIRDVQLI